MTNTLENLFHELIQVGYDVRSSQADGLQSWQPYKTKYSSFAIKGYESGIPLKQSFIDFANDLDYKFTDDKDHTDVILTITGVILNNKSETNHFLIQHFRIPRLEKNKLSVLKVLQLAYNIGQLKAVIEKESVYNSTILKFYYENSLDELSTYIQSCH